MSEFDGTFFGNMGSFWKHYNSTWGDKWKSFLIRFSVFSNYCTCFDGAVFVEYDPMEPRQVPITVGSDGSTRVQQPVVTFTATTLSEAQ